MLALVVRALATASTSKAEEQVQTLSDGIGYLSLACWIVVMFPQIYLNYQRKSGEGVSLVMMVAWVCGDVFNIAGALMQDLVTSTIVIGTYYLFVDSTLLYQTIYYRIVYKAHLAKDNDAQDSGEDEAEQLINSHQTVATHDDLQHASTQDTASCAAADSGAHSLDVLPSVMAGVLSLASVGSLAVMLGALLFSPSSSSSDGDNKDKSPEHSAPESQIVAQAMGTASAVIYIMSYVPQAIQNYQRKSCEGLSIWLFLLSMMGNTTYALAILVVSLDPHYLAPYVPWLLGALVPCLVQIGILYQFYMYPH
ncbi:putative vacuolar membrane transporter for cationic amino acids [Coemansia sp. RSA 2399]|nr:putative vacuolar membrane transporter for cationic amino acids [Coemansia sp. RSA 2399]KAJ1904337.1 putative vacuolar membrane transporter for cationic amino acids [Coemansia sp. IMI 209127]